jgi:Prp8 binding protein
MSERTKRKLAEVNEFNGDLLGTTSIDKRARGNMDGKRGQDLVEYNAGTDGSKALIISDSGIKRTSTLLGPTMLVEGHKAPVHCIKFNPDGSSLASGSFDKTIQLWNVRGENENFMQLEGHKNAILDIAYSSDGQYLASCSADKIVALWDVEVGKRVRTWRGHTNFVNSVSVTRQEDKSGGGYFVASGSDDGSTRLWDSRARHCTHTLPLRFQVTSVAFSQRGDSIFSGCLDNKIHMWDIRGGKIQMELQGHRDTVTGLKLSPDGNFLLSNASDNSLRMWDVRPFFAGQDRCVRVFRGHRHTMEKMLLRCDWSPDGKMVTGGSGDSFVYIWDASTAKLIFKLPGHSGSVNEVSFHPSEPIIGSASSDKKIYLGEI